MSARGLDPKLKFFGTTSVQLRKNGFLAPKRHQHLDFSTLLFGTRGSEVQILSPQPFSNQALTILQILQIEPLVRRLWVPRLKVRFH
jgi:hypothetical protein